jgi:hypothetical protein
MNELSLNLLSFPVVPRLTERAQRIRDLVNVARVCIIEIGRELIEAKDEVAHGEWLPWLHAEFGWGETTARKYMQVAAAFKSSLGVDFDAITIDATALYALAAPAVPQQARDEAVERAELPGMVLPYRIAVPAIHGMENYEPPDDEEDEDERGDTGILWIPLHLCSIAEGQRNLDLRGTLIARSQAEYDRIKRVVDTATYLAKGDDSAIIGEVLAS